MPKFDSRVIRAFDGSTCYDARCRLVGCVELCLSRSSQIVGLQDSFVLMGSNVGRLAIAVFVVNQFEESVDAILHCLLLPLLSAFVLPGGWDDL